jgi:hypothetical protein
VKGQANRLSVLVLLSWACGQVLVGGVTDTTAQICIWSTEARLSLAGMRETLLKAAEPPICYTRGGFGRVRSTLMR